MWEFIRSLFIKKFNTGANLDFRTEDEKKRDFLHEEIAYGAQYSVYKTKNDEVKTYPARDQKKTSACVAFATALVLGIDNEGEGEGFVDLSPAFIYKQRANFPAEGMIGNDSGDVAKDSGACLEKTLPTPSTEAAINSISIPMRAKEEAHTYKAKNYVTIANNTDIDVINSVLSQGKAVKIFIYGTLDEWGREYPIVKGIVNFAYAPIRHCVTALPYSGFKDAIGKRYIWIQDSYPFGGIFYRKVSEDWIAQRCYFAQYHVNLKNEIIDTKPKHEFTISMQFGDQSEEVKWLQRCLAYEGLFPSNIEPTGYFGGLTLKAVNDFQLKYMAEILRPAGYTNPTGVVGPRTMIKLNTLYS